MPTCHMSLLMSISYLYAYLFAIYIYIYLLKVDLAHLDSWQAISLCVDLDANLLHVILPHVLPTLTFLLFISYIH